MGGAIYGDHWVGKELSVVQPEPVFAGETMQAKVDAELDNVSLVRSAREAVEGPGNI